MKTSVLVFSNAGGPEDQYDLFDFTSSGIETFDSVLPAFDELRPNIIYSTDDTKLQDYLDNGHYHLYSGLNFYPSQFKNQVITNYKHFMLSLSKDPNDILDDSIRFWGYDNQGLEFVTRFILRLQVPTYKFKVSSNSFYQLGSNPSHLVILKSRRIMVQVWNGRLV